MPPAPEIAQDFASGVVARRASDTATRMTSRAAQIEARDRTPIIRVAEHRARREDLPHIKRSMEDIAADQSKRPFEVERGEDLTCQHRATEIRGVAIDRLDHQIGDGFAMVVPRRTVGQLWRDVLAEQARHVLPARRECVVER